MEELRARKEMLAPKGFKIINKSECRVAFSHWLQMKGLGEGLFAAGPQLSLVVVMAVKGKPSFQLFSSPNLKH